MNQAVTIQNLIKRYGALTAVDGVSFSVGQGEIFGLLGPNGAGKTTTVEMIEGLRKPDSGSIEVMGIDALNDPCRLKEIIGVQLQSTTLHDKIKVREVIELFATFYKHSVTADSLLEEVSLVDKSESYIKSLSGGQKQRVALALALVNDPQVLFLDEPTTGLDPQARRNVWESIEKLKNSGKTIILTTHYMEEAETLCSRVGIMDHGKIIAIGSASQLIADAGLDSVVEFSCTPEEASVILAELEDVKRTAELDGKFTVYTHKPSAMLQQIASLANRHNIMLNGLSLKTANLEDVFLALTGRKLRD
ncbi:MAG: ABC transporter ATP-binding protein [Dehalococcoidaceae bacterium]|nr:ABC transporter ATP-binding protein [Dehalococcoidaceae bacterium]